MTETVYHITWPYFGILIWYIIIISIWFLFRSLFITMIHLNFCMITACTICNIFWQLYPLSLWFYLLFLYIIVNLGISILAISKWHLFIILILLVFSLFGTLNYIHFFKVFLLCTFYTFLCTSKISTCLLLCVVFVF